MRATPRPQDDKAEVSHFGNPPKIPCVKHSRKFPMGKEGASTAGPSTPQISAVAVICCGRDDRVRWALNRRAPSASLRTGSATVPPKGEELA